jgi:hypothetical protein
MYVCMCARAFGISFYYFKKKKKKNLWCWNSIHFVRPNCQRIQKFNCFLEDQLYQFVKQHKLTQDPLIMDSFFWKLIKGRNRNSHSTYETCLINLITSLKPETNWSPFSTSIKVPLFYVSCQKKLLISVQSYFLSWDRVNVKSLFILKV